MKNWKESNEHIKVKPVLKKGDILDMPEMSTQAFTIIRDDKKYKVRLIQDHYAQVALRIHKELLSRGWDLPKVYVELVATDNLNEVLEYSFTEWVEGKTFWELYHEKNLGEEDFYKLGQWAGRLNAEQIDGKYVSVLNYFHKNNFKRDNGVVESCDLNKLYLTDFPQAFIEKYVTTEDIVTFPEREAFLKGYREFKEYDNEKVLKWHIDNVYSGYHDIYFHDKLVFKGFKDFKGRMKLIDAPKDMTGMRVVDFGCSGGMFCLECAQRGASYIYGTDVEHYNVENRHHRLSDMTKHIAYCHGFDGRDLHFKHIELNADWVINEHIPKLGRGEGKIDIGFCLCFIKHLSEERKKPFMKMLSDRFETVYFEGEANESRDTVHGWLKETTDFPVITYLGDSKDINEDRYCLFRCSFKRRLQMYEVCKNIFTEHFKGAPIRGIEIGVLGGSWTAFMLLSFPNITELFCIDPWKNFEDHLYERGHSQEVHNANFEAYKNKTKPYGEKVHTYKMGSEEAIDEVKKHGPFDFVFIDGCHDEEFIRRDIEYYYPLVKPGGFFGGHDYGLAEGVTKTVDKVFPDAQKGDDFVWWITKK